MIGYAQIKAKVETERLLPWASSTSHKIAGYEIMPLTLSSLVDLQLSDNFIVGGEPDDSKLVGDVLNYIWRHTEHYRLKPNLITRFHKYVFLRKLSKVLIEKVAKECVNHFEYAMEETPAGVSISNGTSRNLKMSASPSVAYLVDEVCGEYTITISECMNTPIKQLFQLMRCIRLRKRSEGRGGDISYSEPKEVKDFIKTQLNQLNQSEQNG